MTAPPDRTPPPILAGDDVDALGRQHLQLVTEVWILRDRVRVLETLLERAGLLDPNQLDDFVPDEALRTQLRRERDAFVERIIGLDPAERTVERLRERAR